MDILNKMRVPELKSVLREYKKVHYQPYSKLNREGLIKLIVRHKLHENDLSKHIKVKVITKKKTPPKKDENKPKLLKPDKPIEIQEDSKNVSTDYLTRIHKKYPTTKSRWASDFISDGLFKVP